MRKIGLIYFYALEECRDFVKYPAGPLQSTINNLGGREDKRVRGLSSERKCYLSHQMQFIFKTGFVQLKDLKRIPIYHL